uniref:NACHT, LRR and PYD domains-containing protein 12-like n=1 Tax=Maylandia zebra TaxID=106582 RepID=UPI000D3186B4|nr:NACHT, LRR and PYD domains-containing protein 12-like [Maylandia zebra]
MNRINFWDLLTWMIEHGSRRVFMRLSSCKLSEEVCTDLLSVVSSQSCSLRELDLSTDSLKASAVKLLSAAVESPHAKLNILRLNVCEL